MWSRLPVLYAVGSPLFPWLTSVCPVCSWYVPCSSICWIDALLGRSPVVAAWAWVPQYAHQLLSWAGIFGVTVQSSDQWGKQMSPVILSTGVAVSGACWHCAWCQWYEVCGVGSGVEAIPLPPRLHHGFICHFAFCGLWGGVASVPVHKWVICPILGLCLWCHGYSGGW